MLGELMTCDVEIMISSAILTIHHHHIHHHHIYHRSMNSHLLEWSGRGD